MKAPVVSVVMAVYNGERYLTQAIESVLAQTYADFEFIIIDDASQDGSWEMIRRFEDKRIVAIRLERNGGQTAALNRGLRIARGEFIARLDADDVALPNRFKEQGAFLEQHRDIAVIGCAQQIMDANGRVYARRSFPTDPDMVKAGLITSSPLSWYVISHPTVMGRKSVFLEMGGYDERFRIAQDYALWSKIIAKYRIGNLDSVGVQYRFHPGSLSQHNLGKTKQEIALTVHNNIARTMPQLSANRREALQTMLLFDVQQDRMSNTVLGDFESFYKAFCAQAFLNARVKEWGQLIQMWYVPQLIKTHKILAIKAFLTRIIRYPKGFLTKRFLACCWYAFKKKW